MDTTKITTQLQMVEVPDNIIQELIANAQVDPNTKKTFEYLKAGDLIFAGWRVKRVERVTNTMVIIGEDRWNRRTGNLIGENDPWHRGNNDLTHIIDTTLESYTQLRLKNKRNLLVDAAAIALKNKELSYEDAQEVYDLLKTKGLMS